MLEMMFDAMVRKFGFEAKETLLFCGFYQDFEKGILSERELVQEFEEIIRER